MMKEYFLDVGGKKVLKDLFVKLNEESFVEDTYSSVILILCGIALLFSSLLNKEWK